MDGVIGEMVSEFHEKLDTAYTLVSGTSRWCFRRSENVEIGCTTDVLGTKCVCDTDFCNDEVIATQSPPVECYECYGCDQPTDQKCTGEVCIKDTDRAFTSYTLKLSSIILCVCVCVRMRKHL